MDGFCIWVNTIKATIHFLDLLNTFSEGREKEHLPEMG